MMKAFSAGVQIPPGSGMLPGPGTPRQQEQAAELFCLLDTGALELITLIIYQGTDAQSLNLGDGWSLLGQNTSAVVADRLGTDRQDHTSYPLYCI